MGVECEINTFEERSSPADSSPESRAAQLHRWIRAYEERLEALVDELDERWVVRRVGRPSLGAWRDGGRRVRRQLIVAMLGSEHPSATALRNPANRLALLPTEQLHWVLRARALYSHAAGLRRCVDGRLIDRVAAALGPEGANVVAQLGALFTWEHDDDPAPILRADPLEWSFQGLMRFTQDGVWDGGVLEAMIRMSLPPDQVETRPTLTRSRAQGLYFLRCVPTLFPDTSWLFG